MTTAAIYARVSSARQRGEQTVDTQTAALIEAAERWGLEVPAEWRTCSPLTSSRPHAGAAGEGDQPAGLGRRARRPELDRDAYLKLAEDLEGFLARLRETSQDATVEDRQRVLRTGRSWSARSGWWSGTRFLRLHGPQGALVIPFV